MNKRYSVEELVGVSENDAEWEPQTTRATIGEAKTEAIDRIKPTPYGDSGVRVVDTEEQKVVFCNC